MGKEEVEVERRKKRKEKKGDVESIGERNSSLFFQKRILSHPNLPTWIWSAPYVLSSIGKLGDVAAALVVTKGRERRGEGEREAERSRRRARGGIIIIVAVAAIDDCCADDADDECNAAVLPALPLALARQAAASERIAAATTRRDAGRASSAL